MQRVPDDELAAAVRWIAAAIRSHSAPDAMAVAATLSLRILDSLALSGRFDRLYGLPAALMAALPPGAMLSGHLPILEAAEAALGAETTLEGRVALGAQLVARALVDAGQGDDVARRIVDGSTVWQALARS